jgi:hypothetical protein
VSNPSCNPAPLRGKLRQAYSTATPISGYFTDTRGAEWVNFWSILLALPWWGLLIIEGHLALFITCYVAQSEFSQLTVHNTSC